MANRLPRFDGPQVALPQISSAPEICCFYGIVIRMLATEHAPPNFHAAYGEHEISVSIREGNITGTCPVRARRHHVLPRRALRHSKRLVTE